MYSLKRRYPRYTMDKPVVAYRAYEDMKIGIRGQWQTFGEGGLGARMSEQLRSGEVIAFELSPTLRVYAAVRYCQAFHHGFEFVLLKDRQKAEIARMCRELGRQTGQESPKRTRMLRSVPRGDHG
ncbi:MAG TPA: PilZ domain-containing protein [Terriglobales bacterium]|nr:PilZ domain-containing protein [Terriglobales bacterium]